MYNYENNCCRIIPYRNQHVHEFLESTKIAERRDDPHNHRFAGITGPAIPYHNSHVHQINTRTDSTDHFHRLNLYTGPAIDVGFGRHVHPVCGDTSFDDGHVHRFIFTTLIERPN